MKRPRGAISPTEMPWTGATVHTGLHHAQPNPACETLEYKEPPAGRGSAIVAGNSVSNDYPGSDCGTSSLLLATHDADSAVWEVARAKVISHFNVISPCFAKAKQGASVCGGH